MNNTADTFEEFSEIVGTKIPEEAWYLFFNQEGFVRGIQGPSEKKSCFYHRQIRTYAQARDFLCAHNRPELVKGLNKIGWRGKTRERIYK